MNSRERVRLILNHQEADRPAIDLGSTRMTGSSAWTYRALKRRLGIHDDRVRVIDPYQMLAHIEEPVLDAFGADFVMLPLAEMALGLRGPGWKPFTFWDGQTMDLPEDFNPTVTADGALESPQDIGSSVIMRMPKGGRYFDVRPDCAPEIDIPHKPESEWKFRALTDEFLESERRKARLLYESTDRAIVASPSPHVRAPQGYADTYSWAMKMLTDPQHCLDYMMRFGEAAARNATQYLQAVGEYIDVIVISGTDFGMQTREMFRPDLFRDNYVPSWRLMNDAIHRFPHVKSWIHCCGSVPNLLPHFIAAGVDCLNPVQWTATGMDLKTIKAKYGKDLVFWGGAVNTQRTFPFGTADDVAREARDVLKTMAPGGGFVVNPIHNILSEVPLENILALYKTAQEYRYT